MPSLLEVEAITFIEDICNIKQQQKRWIVVSRYCKILPDDVIKLCEAYCKDCVIYGWNIDAVDPYIKVQQKSNILSLDENNTTFRNAFGDFIMKPNNIYNITIEIQKCNGIHFGVCSLEIMNKYTKTNNSWHLHRCYREGISVFVDFITQLQRPRKFIHITVDLKSKQAHASFSFDQKEDVIHRGVLKPDKSYALAVMMFGGPNVIQLFSR